jgi:hypothetical protein
MVTVGYGDITPVTSGERICAIIIMIFSVGMYAYTINTVGRTFSKYSAAANKYEERMKYVNRFMK